MTQLEYAKKGKISDEMRIVAENENRDLLLLLDDIKKGHTIIAKSKKHHCSPTGIGKRLRIKVNANIGTSTLCRDPNMEIHKCETAIKYGSDTIMDLSTGGDINAIRKTILEHSGVPVGTVPVYQAITNNPDVSSIKESDYLDSIYKHIDDGVDFITIHCGIKKNFIPLLSSRILGVVSRGGSFLVKWMLYHNKENPLYIHYDEICEMAKKNDVVLSLGDGFRPGCLADATDKAQIAELEVLGELASRARAHSVQVMIEGPGHVPMQQIKKNIELQKKICNGAPFYVLGPLVTDISPGYDHITGAIGGALACFYGADFICYLTPTEHLGLPGLSHVIDGVIASKIAAHAADIARGIPNSMDIDNKMAKARSELDWNAMFSLAMNKEKAETLKHECGTTDSNVCSMCGDLCSAKINKESKTGYK